MDDTVPVRVRQSRRDLGAKADDRLEGQAAAHQPRVAIEGLAGNLLHRDPRAVWRVADIVNVADSGMAECRRGARLMQQRPAGRGIPQKLQRDIAAERESRAR